MKTVLSLLLLAATPAFAQVGPGSAPPTLTLSDTNSTSPTHGTKVRAGGKGIVGLWFFVDESPHTAAQIDALDKLARSMRDDGVTVSPYVVVPDRMAEQAAKLTEGHDVPVFSDTDGAAFTAWGAKPGDLFILDLDGRVRDQVNLHTLDLRERFNRTDLEARIEVIHFDLPNL